MFLCEKSVENYLTREIEYIVFSRMLYCYTIHHTYNVLLYTACIYSVETKKFFRSILKDLKSFGNVR